MSLPGRSARVVACCRFQTSKKPAKSKQEASKRPAVSNRTSGHEQVWECLAGIARGSVKCSTSSPGLFCQGSLAVAVLGADIWSLGVVLYVLLAGNQAGQMLMEEQDRRVNMFQGYPYFDMKKVYGCHM